MGAGRWGSERRWIQGMAMASQIGIFLALSVAIGWFVGQWLDGWLGTAPWLMILFTLFGIAAGFLEMFRVVMRLSRDEDAESGGDR